jgi:hypothetical protein
MGFAKILDRQTTVMLLKYGIELASRLCVSHRLAIVNFSLFTYLTKYNSVEAWEEFTTELRTDPGAWTFKNCFTLCTIPLEIGAVHFLFGDFGVGILNLALLLGNWHYLTRLR